MHFYILNINPDNPGKPLFNNFPFRTIHFILNDLQTKDSYLDRLNTSLKYKSHNPEKYVLIFFKTSINIYVQ